MVPMHWPQAGCVCVRMHAWSARVLCGAVRATHLPLHQHAERARGGLVRDAARLLAQRERAHVQALDGLQQPYGQRALRRHRQAVRERR